MTSFRQITAYLVYFINVFLVFLLFFEERVQVPVLIQVTGRMHTMLLHFPLVLLFVGILLEVISLRKEFRHPVTAEITAIIFHLFALTAAITALFGFFLLREGTYLGDEVSFHKWLGTAVSGLAVVLLWLQERSGTRYYAALAVSAICLVVAGHLGAEITHGKGFLTEPIRKNWNAGHVAIEHPDSAIVFRDVIQPILNEKCVQCHNANRAKNNLILSDYEGVLAGGEKPAVVPGAPGKSALYQYITLPLDDSLHMPPADKAQLDPEEIRLIAWWIARGAHAAEKYKDVPKVDSIQEIMIAKFQPRKGIDLVHIDFADQQKISGLNNPYRTVQQISATKPYIAVFMGSKQDFRSTDLEELKPVSKQIVSMDLGNSNVGNAEIKSLRQFPHLQRLHLQNNKIGNEGIKELEKLRYLEVLNLSGTAVSDEILNDLAGWENLRKLYLYNTSVSAASVSQLQARNPALEIFQTHFDLTDSIYDAQLTMPVCKTDSAFFNERALVEIRMSRGKVKYFFTLDGSEPDARSSLYSTPLEVKQSAELRVKASMEGWEDSQVLVVPLMRVGTPPARVMLETRPHPKFSAKLDSTIVNRKAGSMNAGDKEYLGFEGQDFQVLFKLNQPEMLSTIALSYLEDTGKGILSPEHVEVWGGTHLERLRKIGEVGLLPAKELRPAAKRLVTIAFPEQSVQYVRLKAKNPAALPDWHPLRDTRKESSLFVDEISLH